MPAAPFPKDEQARLAALRRYELLDSASEAEYDDLTKIAAQVCGTPIALISLIDSQRQWFKARVGIDATETPRDQAFCAHAILDTTTFVVPDALQDHRFADNALVIGDPRIRFYAGAPLQTTDGTNLGTLCVIDRHPRALSAEQQAALEALARQVVRLVELRYRNRFFASLVDKNPAVMSVRDGAGRLVFANAAWKEQFGPVDDALGKTAAEWLGVTEGAPLFESDVLVLKSGTATESVDVVPSDSGARNWLTVRFPVDGLAGQTMAGAVSVDVTKTVLAEQRWRESEKKFARLCAAAPDAIVSGDERGTVVFWNAAAQKMFGYDEEEIAGKPWSALLAPEDRERFADPERWMRRTTRQFTGVRRDGTAFPAEVSLASWRAADQDYRTCFVRDLTERLRIESLLEQSRRVESLGHVAATVAHEFNNVLMAIGPFNTLIAKFAGADERVLRATSSIERSLMRAKSIVEQILLYARANEPIRKAVDISQWLTTAHDELKAIAGDGIALRLEVPSEPAPVSCDLQQLEQVLANLVKNAREAMSAGGAITVTLEIRDYCADAMLPDGERCARLTVADTGVGMTEATLSRIFEPLFTTKKTGTGIGLALAQRLIEKHGGVITASSTPGRGSEFVIHLPLLQ